MKRTNDLLRQTETGKRGKLEAAQGWRHEEEEAHFQNPGRDRSREVLPNRSVGVDKLGRSRRHTPGQRALC